MLTAYNKIYYLHSHLDFCRNNLGAVSDERFYQDISTLEKRYQRKWHANMLGDYCWLLFKEDPNVVDFIILNACNYFSVV